SLPNKLRGEHQRIVFPIQPGLNLQAVLVADDLLAVRGEFDGKRVALSANDVSPGEAEVRLAVLDYEGRGIRSGYLQRTPGTVQVPASGEIGLRHRAPSSRITVQSSKRERRLPDRAAERASSPACSVQFHVTQSTDGPGRPPTRLACG